MRWLLQGALLAASSGRAAAPAPSVVPAYDARVEEMLLAEGAGSERALAATSVSVVAPGGRKYSRWLPLGGPRRSADLVLRVQMTLPQNVELVLLGRAAADATMGVGAWIKDRSLRLVVLRDRALSTVGPEVRIGEPSRGPSGGRVVALLHLFGGIMWVNLFDEATGELLATSAASGIPTLAGGVVMLGNADLAPLVQVTARSGCVDVPEQPDAAFEQRAPIMLELPVARPSDLRARFTLLERSGADRERVRTDPVGAERLLCSGLAVAHVETELPWKYIDIDYLRARGQPIPRAGEDFDLSASSKDSEIVGAFLAALAAKYPTRVSVESMAKSIAGRDLWVAKLSDDLARADSRPSVLLVGGIHGDETLGTDIVLDALQETARVPGDLLSRVTVYAVPLLNPDGAQAFLDLSPRAGRKNGRDLDGDGVREIYEGVDVNRNFPFRWDATCPAGFGCDSPKGRHYRGKSAASEPETRALMALAEREHFVASISFHLGETVVLSPYTTGGVHNPEPDEAWPIAERMVASLHAGPRVS